MTWWTRLMQWLAVALGVDAAPSRGLNEARQHVQRELDALSKELRRGR